MVRTYFPVDQMDWPQVKQDILSASQLENPASAMSIVMKKYFISKANSLLHLDLGKDGLEATESSLYQLVVKCNKTVDQKQRYIKYRTAAGGKMKSDATEAKFEISSVLSDRIEIGAREERTPLKKIVNKGKGKLPLSKGETITKFLPTLWREDTKVATTSEYEKTYFDFFL